MKTLNLKAGLLFLSISLLIGNSFILIAQPARKAMERIEQMKMMKLLEHLDLDEANAEKFLVKYNSLEKNIKSKMDALDQATETLKNRIKEKAPKDELAKMTDKVIELQLDLGNAFNDKLKAMKGVLPEDKYAIYVVFESTFTKELRENIFNMIKKRDRMQERMKEKGFGPPPNDR